MLKRQGIDALVADRLLAAEATKRGVTVERLVEAEVSSKVPPASDAEVDNFCARNPGQCDQRASNDGSPRLEQVRAYLTEQKRTARRDAFVAALRATSDVKVYLAAVPVFRAEVGPGATPVRGPANAPITIVEFSDFHCPYCRMVQPTLDRILEKYPTQVRFAYRDIPLDALHPQARAVAEAARCANDQGKFWPFHDTVYRSAARADETSLKMMAAAAGLDVAPFMACVASGKHKASLEQDAADAARLGVNSTPSFFINGRPLRGAQPFEAFVQVIEDELARARK
jgi:protein-disulfide isomerase